MSKLLSLLLLASCLLKACAENEKEVHFSPPVIDIAPLIDPHHHTASDVARVRHEILQASNTWGFFQVLNHGIKEDLQQQLFDQMHLFFGSPPDTKYTVRRTEDNSRGFADDELTKRLKDVKEIFDVGQVPYTDLTPEALKNQIVDGFNQWPAPEFAHLQQFKPTVDAYYDACLDLSRTLVKAMAEVIPCANETYFTNAFDRHSSFLRLNYYPTLTDGVDAGAVAASIQQAAESTTETAARDAENGASDGALPRRLGVSRHTDAGALTVLLQDPNPAIQHGLEVYSGSKEDAGDGVWVPVTPVPGSLTINTGDMLQVWSNGLLKAPEHRVRPTMDPQRVRYSAPFFYNPNYDALVTPLTTQCTPAARVLPLPAPVIVIETGTIHIDPVIVIETGTVEPAITIDFNDDVGASQEPAQDSLYGAHLQEQVKQATAAPRYNGIRWGDYRNQRFVGDFKDVGEEVQIEHFQA